jgi:argininosuccinate lyase
VVGEAGRRVSEGRRPLWSGRFAVAPAPEAAALGRSIGFDLRLAPYDVAAGIAHVAALRDAGLLDDAEATALTDALREVGAAIADGTLQVDEADEDVHSVVERAVTERLGDLGARLHAGRSRNDLVAADLRLWLLDAGRRIGGLTTLLIRTLLRRAREEAATPMPGTTHARPAQVVTLGHHLGAHAWALTRDLDRLDGWADRADSSPLGAGAVATSTLGLDPSATSTRLGFARAFGNSIDAVSDRDVVQEFLAVAAIAATHLSRLAADVARWTDPALGWAELDEAYSTGSSMMPQKRNPDAAELARAKAARVVGAFVTVSGALHGLPLGYQRDLQEDKEPAFDAADTIELVLAAAIGAVDTLRFDRAALRRAACDPDLYATDVAEAMVRSGVPFREAHRRTGELLRALADEGRTLADLRPDEWAALGLAEDGVALDPDRSIAARSTPGGPSPASVERQVDELGARLAARSLRAG